MKLLIDLSNLKITKVNMIIIIIIMIIITKLEEFFFWPVFATPL